MEAALQKLDAVNFDLNQKMDEYEVLRMKIESIKSEVHEYKIDGLRKQSQ